MGVNSLPKTVTRQRRDCDLNSGPSAPESSTLTTRIPSHPTYKITVVNFDKTMRIRVTQNVRRSRQRRSIDRSNLLLLLVMLVMLPPSGPACSMFVVASPVAVVTVTSRRRKHF